MALLELVSGAIGALVGLGTILGLIISPIVKLNKTITSLGDSLESIKENVNDYLLKNAESHRRIWSHNDSQDKIINQHEIRITLLERERGQETEQEVKDG